MSSGHWAATVPLEAGVYVLWKNNKPCYVGETSSLRHRMRDLARAVNHTFTRQLCKEHGFEEGDSSKVANLLATTYTVSFVAVPLGRTELEEYLVLRWYGTLRNKVAKRLLVSRQYEWVKKT